MSEVINTILDPNKMPRHLAVIMDGNGRWARMRGWNRIVGHRRGVESVNHIVKACRELGIEILTLYAFSQENWQRPQAEVSALMRLLSDYLEKELGEMLANDISLRTIGNIEKLPSAVTEILMHTIQKTAANRSMILNLALSYGGRDEITRAVRKIAGKVLEGSLNPAQIDERCIENALDTHGLPDPDFLIRTSGEFRMSNFLIWQMAYTEIYVTDVLWPDFRKEHLLNALYNYQGRERRFGLTSDQIQASQ